MADDHQVDLFRETLLRYTAFASGFAPHAAAAKMPLSPRCLAAAHSLFRPYCAGDFGEALRPFITQRMYLAR
jgi:hypothetical protein